MKHQHKDHIQGHTHTDQPSIIAEFLPLGIIRRNAPDMTSSVDQALVVQQQKRNHIPQQAQNHSGPWIQAQHGFKARVDKACPDAAEEPFLHAGQTDDHAVRQAPFAVLVIHESEDTAHALCDFSDKSDHIACCPNERTRYDRHRSHDRTEYSFQYTP